MVAHPGATGGPGRARQLNRPRSVRVEAAEDGRPIAVWLSPGRAGVRPGRHCVVEAVLEVWRIDDEWWRERPVSRMYWRVLLEDRGTVTVYRDLVRGRWWRQALSTYGNPPKG